MCPESLVQFVRSSSLGLCSLVSSYTLLSVEQLIYIILHFCQLLTITVCPPLDNLCIHEHDYANVYRDKASSHHLEQ